jgi:uncharacterized membrane protein HdeD (DUF308 family)
MRKGILALGTLLLIIGVIALGFAAVAYSHFSYNQAQISSGNAWNNATNQALLSTQLSDAIAGFISGVTFFIVGIVLTIVGFKGKSKKEKEAEKADNKTN